MAYTTISIQPPLSGLYNLGFVNGRVYYSTPSVPIAVPDFDALILLANGWTRATGSGSSNTPGPKTLRNIATRCRQNNQTNAAYHSLMNRTVHLNQGSPVTSLAVMWSNWYAAATGEFAGPSDLTITASIEYPSNTFTQVTFGGSATGSFGSNSNLISDQMAVIIPRGARFWIRSYIFTTIGGVCYSAGTVTDQTGTSAGEACTAGTGAGTDLTMSGSVTNSPVATGTAFFPTAVIGMSNVPSVLAVGDSRCAGSFDNPALNIGYSGTGEIARSLDARLPYCNVGCGSDRAQYFNTPLIGSVGSPLRMSLAPFHTHAHCEYGTNDLTAGTLTTAQLMAQLQTLWNSLAAVTGAAGVPLKVSQSTISPVTTSTDSWATLGNQTVAPSNANRIAANNLIRGTPAPLWAYFDVADAVESARNSGIWKAPGISTDGTHETPVGYRTIADLVAIDATLFV